MSTSPCGRARRILWPAGEPRVATPEVIAAQQHLATCDDCRAFLDEMRRISTTLSSLAPRDTAPADVRERLFTALARERSGVARFRSSASRAVRWAAAVSVAALLVGGVALLRVTTRRSGAEAVAAMVVNEHVRSGDEARLSAGDAEVVTRWLAPQVSFAVHVPSLPNADLRGARVVSIDGRRAAVIEYAVRGTAVSYFVIPEPDRPGTPGEPPRLGLTSRAGYRLVTWHEPGLLHAMVGDLPNAELASLARACIEQMRRTVALAGDGARAGAWTR
jgi:anti-sigma factor RsiW